MKKEKYLTFISIIAVIVIAVLVISASVTITLFDRGSYIRLTDKQSLPDATGIDREEILANYNALIDYNSIFFKGPLVFPTFTMSDTGRIHFEEVKTIFSAFQFAMIISAVLSVFFSILLLRRRSFRFLAFGGILALLIPAAVVCAVAIIGWDRFFVIFHQVFFNNEFWVFDAQTDPVILILPDEFFLNCLVRIVTGTVISAILLITSSVFLAKCRDRSRKMNEFATTLEIR